MVLDASPIKQGNFSLSLIGCQQYTWKSQTATSALVCKKAPPKRGQLPETARSAEDAITDGIDLVARLEHQCFECLHSPGRLHDVSCHQRLPHQAHRFAYMLGRQGALRRG